MKTTLKIAAACVVALLALPAVIGALSRPSFDALVQAIEARHSGVGEVAPDVTHAGWFQTRRRVSVAINDPVLRTWLAGLLDDAQTDTPLYLDLHIALRHGPLPFAAGRDGALSPALANTRLTWSVRQDGTSVAVPAQVVLSSGPRRTTWHLSIEAHEYTSSEADAAHLMHAGAQLDGSFENDRSSFDGRGSLGDITLLLADGRRLAALGGSLQINLHDQQAQGTLRFDELQRANLSAAGWRIDDVTVNGNARIENDRVVTMTDIVAGEGRIGDATRSNSANARLEFVADAKAAAEFARFAAAAAAGQGVDAGPSIIGTLAARGVSVAVPEFLLDTPDGMMQAQMEGALPAGQGDARDMLQRSSGSAEVVVPVALLRRAMASSPDLEASLQYAMQARLINRRGQQFVSNWRLRDGGLRINGRPVPLPL